MGSDRSASRRWRWLVAVVVVLAASAVSAGVVAARLPGDTTAPGAVTSDRALPFSVAPGGQSDPKVFAHYFPPYPISLDDKPPASDYYARGYLAADGEAGAHAAYGGLLRDRPLGRDPVGGDWRLKDLETEVAQAAGAGIDGFTVDVLSLSGSNWDQTVRLMQAASDVGDGFVVVPNLDMTTSAGHEDIATIAAGLDRLLSSPSAYRLADGRWVLSTFKAENQPPAWWQQLETVMAQRYGHPIALISVLLSASEQNLRAYAPISYELGEWGERDAAGVSAETDKAALAHQLGVRWMAPVAVQDERPRSGLYAEAQNTTLLRTMWATAISQGADDVQLVTWNDYSEGTSIAPSADHGRVFLDLCAYYIQWFAHGSPPTITGDAVYVTHRIQFADARPTGGQTTLMEPSLAGSQTRPRDEVEVLTVLQRPATVTVTVGGTRRSYPAPAGEHVEDVPLATGRIGAEVVRDGAAILSAASPFAVASHPVVQDLGYYAVGAAR